MVGTEAGLNEALNVVPVRQANLFESEEEARPAFAKAADRIDASDPWVLEAFFPTANSVVAYAHDLSTDCKFQAHRTSLSKGVPAPAASDSPREGLGVTGAGFFTRLPLIFRE